MDLSIHPEKRLTYIGDNVIPAIWSLAEVYLATICACLPAIRLLLAKWFPAVFDLNTLPRSTPQGKSGSNQISSTLSELRSNFREIKTGPSYNERPIKTPDEQLLARLGDVEDRTASTKKWIQQSQFDDIQRLVASPVATKSRNVSQHSDQSTEMFALQGPRLSQGEQDVVEEGGHSRKASAEWKRRNTEIMVVNRISVQSLRVPENDLAADPQRIVPREWTEEWKNLGT